MHKQADKIRNVALVGHRGSGNTSLNEALLYQAGAITRMGSVDDGSTVSDVDPDEQQRGMSISATLSSFEWDGRKVNLIDTPGEPSFVADALGALRVCESAVFVVNAVMGVEVSTQRLWQGGPPPRGARPLSLKTPHPPRGALFPPPPPRTSALRPPPRGPP